MTEHETKNFGVLVTIGIFLIVQTMGLTWWMSGTSTTLAFMKDELASFKISSNTADAKASVIAFTTSNLEAKVAILRMEFDEIKANGSPRTDKRLTAIEYQLGLNDAKDAKDSNR
jgi:hypothetical protein